MNSKRQRLVQNLIFIILFYINQAANAQNLAANTATQDAGAILDSSHPYYRYIENIDKYYTDGTISIQFKPIARSLREISQGETDFHLYYPCITNADANLPLKNGNEVITTNLIAIYSSPKNPLTPSKLQNATLQLNAYKLAQLKFSLTEKQTFELLNITGTLDAADKYLTTIEKSLQRKLTPAEKTQLIQLSYPYVIEVSRLVNHKTTIPVYNTNNMRMSLRKLLANRIDGLIHSATVIETIAQREQAEDRLARAMFDVWDICFVVKNSPHGEFVNEKVSAAIRAYKASPDYHEFETLRRAEQEWFDRYGPQKNQQTAR